MSNNSKINNNPYLFSIGFFLSVILAEYVAILYLNNGMLVYTLDDPYIHLALAENIMNGHYGVNSHEFSAPSSSILWPFILAPFSSHEYFPLVANLIISMASIIIFVKILEMSINTNDDKLTTKVITIFTILLILLTNQIGLVFNGMEHSLQVFLTLLIAYGLIIDQEKGKIKLWLIILIILAPLVRYENLAISIPSIIYLLLRRQYLSATFSTLLIIIFIVSFSYFLTGIGLEPFPTSISVKSDIVETGGKIYSIAENIKRNLMNRQGIIFSLSIFVLLAFLTFSNDIKKRNLALITIVACLLHIVAGRFGWYNRYEIYVWSLYLVISLYLYGPYISTLIQKLKSERILDKGIFLVISFSAVIGAEYITDLFSIPLASNNIYEQQYQMHRFVTEYYKKPVAVNDLGYVSYKNNNYVLDLWGLASQTAFKSRKNQENGKWMKNITYENSVSLAMIYQDAFSDIPQDWKKIGDLYLGRKRITAARDRVAFYITSNSIYSNIIQKLNSFIPTLPHGVVFEFVDPENSEVVVKKAS